MKLLRSFFTITLIIFCCAESLYAQTATAPASGDGSSGNPYQIGTLENLYWIADQTNNIGNDFAGKYFKQTANIDATTTSTWFSGAGWTPINGDNNTIFFSGSYNGQGHTISNLNINRLYTSNVGLFGIAVGGTIENINLTNISITAGGNSAGNSIGGLIGYTYGGVIVSNCSVSGSVSGWDYVGGLIGYNDGSAGTNTINNCHSDCTVTTDNSMAGGLIGSSDLGTVIDCCATGSVFGGTTASYIGGLIGSNYGTVSNCYATGSATGKFSVGGFIGSNSGAITNCYSTGTATSNNPGFGDYCAGFIGYNSGQLSYCYTVSPVISTVTSKGEVVGYNNSSGVINNNCFWNTDVYSAGCGTNSGTFSAVGENTEQLRTQSTFTTAGWNFTSPWARGDNYNSGYPYLQWQSFPTITFTDGSAFTQSISPDSTNQAVGRFQLTGSTTGAALSAVSIQLNGARTGLTNLKLWSSTDATFCSSSDTQLGSTVAVDPGDGNVVSFTNLSSSICTSGTYYFLTGDVAASPTGTVQGVIVQNSSLTIGDGTISGTITNTVLSTGTVALPVELTEFAVSTAQHVTILKWKTATEVNNYGFEIERRSVEPSQLLNGSSGQWQKIGFIQGTGTSNTPKEYSYTDVSVSSGTYAYRLKQVDNNGTYKYSSETEVTISVPKVFALNQNYPNPFNPTTTISFTLAEDGFTTLKIYDVLGKEVATLVNGEMKAGMMNTVNFNASKLSSGIYFSRLENNGSAQIKKLVLMK
jgi:hypothetical protein